MTTHVALLRAINLAGHQSLKMSDVRAKLEKLGFRNVQTIGASGNVVFDSKKTAAQLEKILEKEFGTECLVRTASEWDAIVRVNPFPKEAKSDPARLLVTFLKSDAKTFDPPGAERMHAIGRELYIIYPDGIGQSKLRSGLIEKKCASCSTARNWNTVLKLHAASQRNPRIAP